MSANGNEESNMTPPVDTNGSILLSKGPFQQPAPVFDESSTSSTETKEDFQRDDHSDFDTPLSTNHIIEEFKHEKEMQESKVYSDYDNNLYHSEDSSGKNAQDEEYYKNDQIKGIIPFTHFYILNPKLSRRLLHFKYIIGIMLTLLCTAVSCPSKLSHHSIRVVLPSIVPILEIFLNFMIMLLEVYTYATQELPLQGSK